MKTFDIYCIILDKIDPSDEHGEVTEIELNTRIQTDDTTSLLQMLQELYHTKEIISIQEIL